jgi:DNA modification methylase
VRQTIDPLSGLGRKSTKDRATAVELHDLTSIPDSADLGSPATDLTHHGIAPSLARLTVPIDSVELHPRNPRVGDVTAVAASLHRFGQQKPVVVQASTRYVVAGNHVLLAARSLGWTEIAANIVELDDAMATGFMIADNRTSDLGGYDDAILAAVLAEAAAADNLPATGYDADDVAAIVAAAGLAESRDLDACPDLPPPAEVYVRPGDHFELGRHRLLVGDATRAADVDCLLGGTPVDLLVTDPPYGVGYTGKTRRALTIANDDLGEDGTRQLVAGALRAAPLRPGGVFYIFAPAGALHLAFLLALRDAGLSVHQTLIWLKDQFVLGHADYHARYEPILYGWRGGAAHHFVADRTQDTVWEVPRPARNTEHPTMKPVALIERAIRNSSRPAETIYDPFVGSGTTLIAAEIAGREAFAMEIDSAYAQVALERWASLTGRRPILVERGGDRDG